MSSIFGIICPALSIALYAVLFSSLASPRHNYGDDPQ